MQEISLHILDLIQNSIEAEAIFAKLEIIEDNKKDILLIKVSDNGKGMDAKMSQLVLSPFVTTRTTRRIGLGLPLINMNAQNCGGYLNINSKPNKGTVVEIMFKHSHIDRPPMGNLIETIKTVLIGNPDLDFQYEHKVNEKCFSFSAKEIYEALGEIDLSHPDIIKWLEDWLTENISNLYGGKI
ncbi:MAG: ATP-binding protein [Clostridiaceae bacterium]|nr:ATP-binding protein [Clostridiaceae bacterium]